MQRILQADILNKFYNTIVIETITWIGHLLISEFMTFYKHENEDKFRIILLDDHSLAVIARHRIRN